MRKFTYTFLIFCALITAASVIYSNFFTNIYDSAKAGNTSRLQKLLEKEGYNDSSLKRTLLCAIANNRPDTVKMLIQHFNAKTNDVTDSFHTPIILASQAGYKEIIKLLIESGADVNVKLSYVQGDALLTQTPLLSAVNSMKYDTAELLFENGASPESYAYQYQEPPDVKLLKKQKDFVKLCLKKGANLNGNFGSQAISVALCSNDYDLLKQLVDGGARIKEQHIPLAARNFNIPQFEKFLKAGGSLDDENHADHPFKGWFD